MSSFLMTALLGLAVIAGSVSGIALAQDSTTKVEPCLGELCPPKSPREDIPKQTVEGARQGKQMQAQDQPTGQVMPRKKKKQASFERNRDKQQPSKKTEQVPSKKTEQEPSKKTEQEPSKKTASRFNLWNWLTQQLDL
jgi:hypothetical protein